MRDELLKLAAAIEEIADCMGYIDEEDAEDELPFLARRLEDIIGELVKMAEGSDG